MSTTETQPTETAICPACGEVETKWDQEPWGWFPDECDACTAKAEQAGEAAEVARQVAAEARWFERRLSY